MQHDILLRQCVEMQQQVLVYSTVQGDCIDDVVESSQRGTDPYDVIHLGCQWGRQALLLRSVASADKLLLSYIMQVARSRAEYALDYVEPLLLLPARCASVCGSARTPSITERHVACGDLCVHDHGVVQRTRCIGGSCHMQS